MIAERRLRWYSKDTRTRDSILITLSEMGISRDSRIGNYEFAELPAMSIAQLRRILDRRGLRLVLQTPSGTRPPLYEALRFNGDENRAEVRWLAARLIRERRVEDRKTYQRMCSNSFSVIGAKIDSLLISASTSDCWLEDRLDEVESCLERVLKKLPSAI